MFFSLLISQQPGFPISKGKGCCLNYCSRNKPPRTHYLSIYKPSWDIQSTVLYNILKKNVTFATLKEHMSTSLSIYRYPPVNSHDAMENVRVFRIKISSKLGAIYHGSYIREARRVEIYHISSIVSSIWGFPKMVVPPKHPKMIIFSRKTHGCWGNPPF